MLDDTMLNAVLVLMLATSILGPNNNGGAGSSFRALEPLRITNNKLLCCNTAGFFQ
jgi:hypothetical protein